MKVIIAGGRDFDNYDHLFDIMDWYNMNMDITEIVSGGQRTRNPMGGVDWGADYIGELWATSAKIKIRRFPADWDQYGKRAGMLRNGIMSIYADSLVAFWDGKSRGTKDMITRMEKLHKQNVVYGYV